jgi:glycerol-3-phosphate dehydrogenase
VVHLDDLILRRTLMGLLGEVNGPLLEELAGIMAPVLGWSKQDAAGEVERTIQLLEKVHGWCATRTQCR